MRDYHVYIMSNQSRTLYTGVTGDLQKRVHQHNTAGPSTFTRKYNCRFLGFYSQFASVHEAIAAEKQIKGWTRRRKLDLVLEANPDWRDLSDGWY